MTETTNKTQSDNLLKQLYLGTAPKKTLLIYIVVILAFFSAICLIAQYYFLVPYSPLNNHISNQGSLIQNPDGAPIWNTGIFFYGIMLIPPLLYIHNQLEPISPRLAKFCKYFGTICCLSCSMVGIFPEEDVFWHQFFAVIFFIGLVVVFNLDFLIFIQLEKPFSKPKMHLLYIWLNNSFFLGIIIPKLNLAQYNWNIDYRFFDFPIWEWNLLFVMMAWIFWIIVIMPIKIQKSK
jgi:hypothetical membrane protein